MEIHVRYMFLITINVSIKYLEIFTTLIDKCSFIQYWWNTPPAVNFGKIFLSEIIN